MWQFHIHVTGYIIIPYISYFQIANGKISQTKWYQSWYDTSSKEEYMHCWNTKCRQVLLIEMRCLFIKQIYIHELCLNEVYENNTKWLNRNCLFCNTECSEENEKLLSIQRKINVSLKLPNPSVIAFLSLITLTFTHYITSHKSTQ